MSEISYVPMKNLSMQHVVIGGLMRSFLEPVCMLVQQHKRVRKFKVLLLYGVSPKLGSFGTVEKNLLQLK